LYVSYYKTVTDGLGDSLSEIMSVVTARNKGTGKLIIMDGLSLITLSFDDA
jgi:hypothetical protein